MGLSLPHPDTGISMLLCPEASHTSPISMLRRWLVHPWSSAISSSCSSKLADGVLTLTLHLRSAPACVFTVGLSHEGVMLMVEPGEAVPHITTSAFCCIIMPFLKGAPK